MPDPARFTSVLDTRRNIDAVAKDVIAVNDDVANVYSDVKQDARSSFTGRSLCHSLLNFNSEGHRIDGTCELDQHAVARRLDNAAVVGSDSRIDDLAR